MLKTPDRILTRAGLSLLAFCLAMVAGSLTAGATQRLALVIGNDVYKNLPAASQLKKARNDARTVAATLEGLGFDMTLKLDVSRSDFNLALDRFARKIEPGDIATFFFAGHGVRIKGRNWKIPVERIAGHRAYAHTACPGKNLASLIPALRKAVAAALLKQ